MILVSLKLDFAVRSYLLQNLISTTGSLATGKLCSHGDFQSKLVDSEQCLMVKGQCLEYLFENDDLQFELVQHIICLNIWTRESTWCNLLLVSACSFIHCKESNGQDKLHQNSITVMGVAELSLKQNAHYGPQMKMTFVEFYPVYICYEGTAQCCWILPYSLPDVVQLNSPPFRQHSSYKFKGCKVTQNLRCGHKDTHSLKLWSRGHSQI